MKLAATLLPVILSAGQPRAQSALDGFDPNANGAINVVVVQPDGKILVGGDFTALAPNFGASAARKGIARLNPDGTLDTAFNPNVSSQDYSVFAIAVQADGKILVGGNFVGGRIARLDGTTGLRDSFDPNANFDVRSIAVQADGKILAGGTFGSIGGQMRRGIARLDPTTGLADSFDPSANATVTSIAVQADGKVLAGGYFSSIGGQARNRIARLDPATGLADSLNPNASEIVLSIVVQPDSKILVGGVFGSIGGQPRNNIARLDATGAADSFNPNASGGVFSMAIQADGKILAGGNFTSIGGQARVRIARVDATTGLADSFNPGATAEVYSIAVQADGKILAGGYFNGANSISGQWRNRIARLETDGRPDQTADPGTLNGNVMAAAVQPDGKILIGGSFTTISGIPRNYIARLSTDATLDMTFDPNAFNPNVSALVVSTVVQADGKILVGGYFTSIGGQARIGIARLDPATGLADSFDPNGNGIVDAIAVQPDGKILVAGTFTTIGGQPRNHIARLDAATGLADSFDPNADESPWSIAVQADGKILVSGKFGSIGGQLRTRIARLDPVTGLADTFNAHPDNTVYTIATQADGKILVGGAFHSIGGQQRLNMARLDPTTGLADSFNPRPDDIVFSIAEQADGKILAGGQFREIGGQTRYSIARLDSATGLADSFDVTPYANSSVRAIVIGRDGKILVGGLFTGIGGHARSHFARLTNDTAALQNLGATPTSITWTRGGSSSRFARVTFEFSNDNVNYTPLGDGAPAGSNWVLTGLDLPTAQNFYIRARGYHRGGDLNASASATESVRNIFLLRPGTLRNISTRLNVQTGDNAMIGGFIVTGTQPKTVIVRGIGPSLPVPGGLADPVIEVHGPSGALLATNDNWRDDPNQQHVIDSGLAPANDSEAALWTILNPGPYTVVVRGNNGATGVGLFEVYDLDQMASSKLGNISTRGFVGTDNNVMIGGAIIIGNPPARVLVRAIGPSLANFGVPNVLGDPTLELYDGNGGLVGTNNNWRDDQEAEIIATSLPPSNNLESAILRVFAPGSYTAIVRGSNNTTGVALVEAYSLD